MKSIKSKEGMIIEKVVKKNPYLLWKEGKEITITFPKAGKQKFICCYDERKQKYFYSVEANHSYHSRLFNKKMDVVTFENVYSTNEMRVIATEKYLEAEYKRVQALEVLSKCVDVPLKSKKKHELLTYKGDV